GEDTETTTEQLEEDRRDLLIKLQACRQVSSCCEGLIDVGLGPSGEPLHVVLGHLHVVTTEDAAPSLPGQWLGVHEYPIAVEDDRLDHFRGPRDVSRR